MKNLRVVLYMAFVALAMMMPQISYAQNGGTQFFSHMDDLPLMQGLTELGDQTVIYDKPQGRFVESWAKIDSQTAEEVSLYYQRTLPQLGWQAEAPNVYFRENERLELKIEDFEDQKFLKATLTPQ